MQIEKDKDLWREVTDAISRDRESGIDVMAQVINRPVGMILGLEASYNPFSNHPYYAEHLAARPFAERVTEMRKPEVRERLLRAEPLLPHPLQRTLQRFERLFPMGELAQYEPDAASSVAAMAAARGVEPMAVVYDLLLERDGHAMLLSAATNFAEGNLDTTLELMQRSDTVLALGDGGAHYGMICDASYPTATLTHWVRDRKGQRLSLAEAIQMLTEQPARLHRFRDRGHIAVGLKADLNIIDLERLKLFSPSVIYDLPGGGKRLSQVAQGYVATYVSGVAIQRGGEDTGARPGRLVRNAGI